MIANAGSWGGTIDSGTEPISRARRLRSTISFHDSSPATTPRPSPGVRNATEHHLAQHRDVAVIAIFGVDVSCEPGEL
jgi:hypothetical protein